VPHNRDTARFKWGDSHALIDDVARDDNFATVKQFFGEAKRNFERRV